MNKNEVIRILTQKIKLVRVESEYTQDKMSEILGISKKTLVQIEKGRDQASWGVIVALCALFRDSEVLQAILGGDPLELVTTIAHERIDRPKEKTMGGKVWWNEIAKEERFILQQNIMSKHYRILDEEGYRWYSSFDPDEALKRLKELLTQ
jgi:DNA-binding XRE family transcriptional regulator